MMSRLILTTFTLLLLSSAVQAQEDSPWWKKLFKKETVEEMEKTPTTQPEEPASTNPTDVKEEPASALDTMTTEQPAFLTQRGDIRISEPQGFASLDSAFRKTPPVVEGYRIQIFFGDLQTARQERSTFLKLSQEAPCYLVQNPPNFVVQVGNYRTQLAAHRDLLELKELYPSALIIPSEIQPLDKKD